MPESNIITGQYVRINQTAASIGTRLVARGIDAIIVVAYAIGIILLMEQAITINRYYIFVFLPAILYSFLFELFNNGQSLGKMIMHIKVVKIDGSTPTIGDYFMRWLLQIIDIDMMGVGALAILLTKNSQRLGDLAAGTMVIKLNNYRNCRSRSTSSLIWSATICQFIRRQRTSLSTRLTSSNEPSTLTMGKNATTE